MRPDQAKPENDLGCWELPSSYRGPAVGVNHKRDVRCRFYGWEPSLGKRTLLIYNPGEPPYDVEKRRHIKVPDLDDAADLSAVFTTICRTNRWGSDETRSGEGSERSRMWQVTAELAGLIREWGITSLLDAPCGDFNWVQDVNLAGVSYRGCDIVDDLISVNTARHGRQDRTFEVLDFTVDPVPYADLILCRDALVHLPYRHIRAALKNFRDSGAKYLLTTTFPDTRENEDIETGWWRPVNLQISPFNLPQPLRRLSDKESEDYHFDKILALWDLQDIYLPESSLAASGPAGAGVTRAIRLAAD